MESFRWDNRVHIYQEKKVELIMVTHILMNLVFGLGAHIAIICMNIQGAMLNLHFDAKIVRGHFMLLRFLPHQGQLRVKKLTSVPGLFSH